MTPKRACLLDCHHFKMVALSYLSSLERATYLRVLSSFSPTFFFYLFHIDIIFFFYPADDILRNDDVAQMDEWKNE